MSKIDPNLLKRYAYGHCTPEETMQAEQWFSQEEEIPEAQFFSGINKEDVKQELWNEVQPITQPETTHIYFLSYIYKVAPVLGLLYWIE